MDQISPNGGSMSSILYITGDLPSSANGIPRVPVSSEELQTETAYYRNGCENVPKNYADLDKVITSQPMLQSQINVPAVQGLLENIGSFSKEIDALELKDLLKNWNLEILFDHFMLQNITTNVLRVIKRHHLERVLKDFDLGTQILFEHQLEEWRNLIGIPLSNDVGLAHCCDISKSSNISSGPPSPALSVTSSSSVSLHKSSAPDHSDIISLSTILSETTKGAALTEYYQKFSKFNEEQRTSLITCIAQYFEDKGRLMSLGASYRLEIEIVERFPTEQLEYYRTSKRGRLYNKASNLRASFNTAVSRHVSENKKKKGNNSETNQTAKSFEPEEGVDCLIRSLKFDNLSAEQFDVCWRACSQYRLSEITKLKSTEEILNKWPYYKNPTGFRLIDMDFNVLYKTGDGLLTKWDTCREKIVSFLTGEGNIKDRATKALLQQLRTDITLSTNGRNAAIFWALHGYLVPTNRIVRKDSTGKNSTTKFTIKDSQESFMFLGHNLQETEDHLRHRKTRKQAIQPFILGIGDEICKISEIYVYFDDIKYVFSNVLRAVDICYKIFYLFNLTFPPESLMFWNFISSEFYKIKPSMSYTKVHILSQSLCE